MDSLQTFMSIVNQSRVLSDDQKKELTDNPSSLPDGYRDQVITLLKAFDEHSQIREEALRRKLKQSFAAFEKEIAASDLDEQEKIQVIRKAKDKIEEFFP